MLLPSLKVPLLACLCAALAGCTKSPHFTTADVAQRVFGGSEHMAAMASASSATAYDIQAKTDGLAADDSILEGYAQGEKLNLSDSQLALLKQLLQEPTSYEFDSGSLCLPHYDVLFVFHTRPRDIRVGLCFSCEQLTVVEGDHLLNDSDNFHPMRPKLLALAKTLFPNDPEIQRLQ